MCNIVSLYTLKDKERQDHETLKKIKRKTFLEKVKKGPGWRDFSFKHNKITKVLVKSFMLSDLSQRRRRSYHRELFV